MGWSLCSNARLCLCLQHILDGVPPRRAACEPHRGVDRALREQVAACGLVTQGDDIARAGEGDAVSADDVTDAVCDDRLIIDGGPAGAESGGNFLGRAAGCVFLARVMGLCTAAMPSEVFGVSRTARCADSRRSRSIDAGLRPVVPTSSAQGDEESLLAACASSIDENRPVSLLKSMMHDGDASARASDWAHARASLKPIAS